HRGLRGFLHDLAELAGDLHAALAWDDAYFDLQHVAAGVGVSQAVGETDFVLLFGLADGLLRRPKHFLEIRVTYDDRRGLHGGGGRPLAGFRRLRFSRLGVSRCHGFSRPALDNLASDLSANRRDSALEIADAGLARVLADDRVDALVGDLDVAFL